MKLLTSISITLALGITILSGCQENNELPNYPSEPSIQLESVQFVDVVDSPIDSLLITISYQDGDGDLGGIVTADSLGAFLYFPNPHTGEEYWVLDSKNPDPGLPPYHCADYMLTDLTPADDVWNSDTIRAEFNPDYYNFLVELWVKKGEYYQEYDFSEVCRLPLGGIFAPVNSERKNFYSYSPFTIYPNNSREGRITYRMAGGFGIMFYDDSMKVKVNIRDEAMHRSNTVESKSFVAY